MSKRAIVIPDERIEVWDAESSLTQAGPRAGVPSPSQTGSMALGAKGEQTAGTSYTIRTQRGGHPVRGGAAYLYRETSSNTDLDWRGWDPPTSISGWEAAEWTDGSGTPEWTRDPDACTAGDGSLVVVVRYRDTGATNEYGVRVYKRALNSAAWQSVDVWGQATAPSPAARSCILALPEGRLHVYSVVTSASGGDTVALWYSDDNGSTWSYGGDCLDAALTGTTHRKVRAAYHRGQVILLVSSDTTSTEGVNHYASDDMGNTFQFVEFARGNGTLDYRCADVATGDHGFVLTYIGDDTGGSALDIFAVVLADAYATFAGSEDSVYDANGSSRALLLGGTGHLAIGATDDGSLLIYWVDGNDTTPSTNAVAHWIVSWDSGATWSSIADYVASKWWQTSTPDYPSALSATFFRGRMAVVGNWVASSGNEDDSVGVWFLGGWTNVMQPPLFRRTDWRARADWRWNWTPIELPGDMGWTAAGAGTQSLGTPGELNLSCTSGQIRTYTKTPTGTIAEGLRVRFVVRPTSGGATNSNRISMGLRLGDGSSSSFEISIRFSTTQMQVYDVNAAANVGSAVTISNLSTAGAEVEVGLGNGTCAVYYRTYLPGDDDRLYSLAASSSSLTDGGAAASTIQFGMRATSGTTDTCDWIEVHYADDDDGGSQNWATTSYPVDSLGRDYGDGTYTDAGMSVIARDGPTWRGEEWVIAARYDYGINRALTVPSPRAGWRSTSTGAQTIAFRWDSLEEDTTESRYLAILLRKSTLTAVTVSLYDGSSWTGVAPATKLGWDGLAYTRSGQVVVPSSGAGLWLDYGEARGASFALDTADARVVHSHAEGRWATSGLRPALRLVDVESGDATSGTGTLTPETVCLLVRVDSDSQAVKIQQASPGASSPPPPASYWEVGSVVVGWVRVLDDPDWSQSEAMRANVEIDVARDATTRSRLAGPAQRVRTVQWMDGAYDLTEHRWGTPSSTLDLGGYAIAAEFGAPLSLPAIVDRLGGGHVPFVYLSDVPDDPGALTVLKRREHILHGRVSSDIVVTNVVGNEGSDELKRIGQMTITEEV